MKHHELFVTSAVHTLICVSMMPMHPTLKEEYDFCNVEEISFYIT